MNTIWLVLWAVGVVAALVILFLEGDLSVDPWWGKVILAICAVIFPVAIYLVMVFVAAKVLLDRAKRLIRRGK